MRFRPEQHLRRQNDFRAIREQGRRINCGAFTLWFLRRAAPAAPVVSGADPVTTVAIEPVGAPVCRVGVVASTAAVGHAVLRNRARRRLREIFRRHQNEVPAGCDILLSARAAMIDEPMPALEQKFVDACRKVAPREHD